MIGQVRGFDLDEFLSDWEPEGEALPWAIGDGGWAQSKTSPSTMVRATSLAPSAAAGGFEHLPAMMSEGGVSPVLKVLFVPDYVSLQQRVAVTSMLYVKLGHLLPGYEVRLAIAEGPFEDHDGVGAHFEADALRDHKKQIWCLKVDLHVSVIKLARHAAMHQPRLIIGQGQGAVVAIAYGHPGCFERVLATRNVQLAELPKLAQAWGNVAAIVVDEPRLSKRGYNSRI